MPDISFISQPQPVAIFAPAFLNRIEEVGYIGVPAQPGVTGVILVHQPVKVKHSQPGPQAGIADGLFQGHRVQAFTEIAAGRPAVGKGAVDHPSRRLQRLSVGSGRKQFGGKGRVHRPGPQGCQIFPGRLYPGRGQLLDALRWAIRHKGCLPKESRRRFCRPGNGYW